MPVPKDVAGLPDTEPGTVVLTMTGHWMTSHYRDQHGEPTEYAVDRLGVGRNLSSEYGPLVMGASHTRLAGSAVEDWSRCR